MYVCIVTVVYVCMVCRRLYGYADERMSRIVVHITHTHTHIHTCIHAHTRNMHKVKRRRLFAHNIKLDHAMRSSSYRPLMSLGIVKLYWDG